MATRIAKPAKSARRAGKVAKKGAAAPALIRARTVLESLAPDGPRPLNVEQAAVLVSCRMSEQLPDDGQGVNTAAILKGKFSDPPVGLNEERMPAFFGNLSTAINDARVEALIARHLKGKPAAGLVVGEVVKLIQFWVDHPDVRA